MPLRGLLVLTSPRSFCPCCSVQRGVNAELGGFLLPLVHDKEERWVLLAPAAVGSCVVGVVRGTRFSH